MKFNNYTSKLNLVTSIIKSRYYLTPFVYSRHSSTYDTKNSVTKLLKIWLHHIEVHSLNWYFLDDVLLLLESIRKKTRMTHKWKWKRNFFDVEEKPKKKERKTILNWPLSENLETEIRRLIGFWVLKNLITNFASWKCRYWTFSYKNYVKMSFGW